MGPGLLENRVVVLPVIVDSLLACVFERFAGMLGESCAR